MKVYIKADSEYDVNDPFSTNVEVRRLNAYHTTSPELLEIYAHDPSLNVRRAVAYNKFIDVDTMHMLAGSSDEDILEGLVRNPNVSSDVLAEIVEREKDNVDMIGVLEDISKNQNTPEEAMITLFNIGLNRLLAYGDTDDDSYYGLIWTAAGNPNTPASVFDDLLDSDNVRIREAMAHNPNMSVDILTRLAKDKDSDVRVDVSRNPNTPEDVLTALATDEEEVVVWGVASNPHTSPNVLDALSQYPDFDVQYSVAGNSSTLPRTLAKLFLESEDSRISNQAAKNPNFQMNNLMNLYNG